MDNQIKTNNRFEFIGNLYPMKDTDKFKAFEDKEYSSGWVNRTLSFAVKCGDSRHIVRVKGGCWKDGGGKIYTLKATEKRGDKPEKIEVPWNQRFDKDIVDSVAIFKCWIADVGSSAIRHDMNTIIKNKAVQEADTEKYGIHTVEEAQKLYDANMAKYKKFITAYDYAEYLNKLIHAESCSKFVFKVSGDIEFYVKNDGSVGNAFNVTRIERMANNTPAKSEGELFLYFNKDAIVDDTQRSKKYFVNAKCFYYDGGVKDNQAYDVNVVIPDDGDKKNINFKNVFTYKSIDRNQWKEIGMKINMIDGAQKEQITEDMLSDNEKEMIELGLATMEEIQADHGAVYGDKIVEWRVCGYARGYMSGAHGTDLTDDDFMRKVKTEDQPVSNAKTTTDEIDIFADDLDEI